MREAVRAAPVAGKQAVRTLAVGCLILAGLLVPYFIPPEFFIRIHRLEFIPAGTALPDGSVSRRDNVLQEREPRWPMRLEWAAVVRQAHLTPDYGKDGRQDIVAVTVCSGSGVWTYKRLGHPVVMPLETWTGDDGCRLTDGTFTLYAQWTYRFLIWSWTADARSAFFTIEARSAAPSRANDP